MDLSRQRGMALIVTLIILMVTTLLVMYAVDDNLLNQKMAAGLQAQLIAFNGAEAGVRAAEAQINGNNIDLSSFKANINFQITANGVDECQEHIFNINSMARYQTAKITILSSYIQVHQPLPAECSFKPLLSHRLWWQQII